MSSQGEQLKREGTGEKSLSLYLREINRTKLLTREEGQLSLAAIATGVFMLAVAWADQRKANAEAQAKTGASA